MATQGHPHHLRYVILLYCIVGIIITSLAFLASLPACALTNWYIIFTIQHCSDSYYYRNTRPSVSQRAFFFMQKHGSITYSWLYSYFLFLLLSFSRAKAQSHTMALIWWVVATVMTSLTLQQHQNGKNRLRVWFSFFFLIPTMRMRKTLPNIHFSQVLQLDSRFIHYSDAAWRPNNWMPLMHQLRDVHVEAFWRPPPATVSCPKDGYSYPYWSCWWHIVLVLVFLQNRCWWQSCKWIERALIMVWFRRILWS